MRAAGADDMAVVGDELVEGGEGFLRTAFLNETDCKSGLEGKEGGCRRKRCAFGREEEVHAKGDAYL